MDRRFRRGRVTGAVGVAASEQLREVAGAVGGSRLAGFMDTLGGIRVVGCCIAGCCCWRTAGTVGSTLGGIDTWWLVLPLATAWVGGLTWN